MKIKDKRDVLILGLGIVVILLGLALSYIFLVQPALNGLVVEGYYMGQEETVSYIMSYAKTCQQLPLTYNNETINLVALECYQQES